MSAAEELKDEFELIEENQKLVRFVADKMIARLPSNIERDDLVSAGNTGLIDAARKFDRKRENKFKTYAEFRIRGAMLDELRSVDIAPRSVRDRQKEFDRAVEFLTMEYGRRPRIDEVGKHLGCSTEEAFTLETMAQPLTVVSMEHQGTIRDIDRKSLMEVVTGGETTEEKLINKIHHKRVLELVATYIERQAPRTKRILDAYFFEALRMKQIGKQLQVSESRVCQIIATHAIRLRRLVQEYEGSEQRQCSE